MSDGIIGNAKFRCSNCDSEHELNEEDIYFEATGGSSREMGDETEYSALISEQCSECGALYEIGMKVWEYPTGIINYSDEEANGVEDLNVNYEIYHKPQEPERDSSRVMGAAAGGAIFGASIGGPFGALIGGIIGGIIGDSVAKGDKNG
ncbi:hypothetical protein [Aliivibrio fischeri]|uniref:hypothetical protein n=1 Tax=Aliivibrio fischeri TaxID=668 RepID=UPI001F37825B|nr:hypothetical protein [Aliivibrio fischeri]MCE7535620.1 hypothetical protein [Aliivibrio fischeri]MCE7559214.1 hypothetical protein [Aliivibrio fischeri]